MFVKIILVVKLYWQVNDLMHNEGFASKVSMMYIPVNFRGIELKYYAAFCWNDLYFTPYLTTSPIKSVLGNNINIWYFINQNIIKFVDVMIYTDDFVNQILHIITNTRSLSLIGLSAQGFFIIIKNTSIFSTQLFVIIRKFIQAMFLFFQWHFELMIWLTLFYGDFSTHRTSDTRGI